MRRASAFNAWEMCMPMWSTPMPDTPLLAAIVWLYLGTNALRVFSYLPQIHAVWRCRDGALSVSLLTWGSWVVSHFFAMLYSTLVVHDLPLLLISLVNLLGCGAVTVIAMQRRRQWQRAQAAAVLRASRNPACAAP